MKDGESQAQDFVDEWIWFLDDDFVDFADFVDQGIEGPNGIHCHALPSLGVKQARHVIYACRHSVDHHLHARKQLIKCMLQSSVYNIHGEETCQLLKSEVHRHILGPSWCRQAAYMVKASACSCIFLFSSKLARTQHGKVQQQQSMFIGTQIMYPRLLVSTSSFITERLPWRASAWTFPGPCFRGAPSEK